MNKTDTDYFHDSLKELLDEMLELRAKITTLADKKFEGFRKDINNKETEKSVKNLAYYLAMRQFDLLRLQEKLANMGLSSLGRSESYVMSNIDAIIKILEQATNTSSQFKQAEQQAETGFDGRHNILEENAEKLFGYLPGERRVHIMVTMPTETADNYELIKELVEHGMSVARINCSHDNKDIWTAIVANIHRASEETGKECRILMDLAGYKIRTGPIALEAPVEHLRVERNEYGKVTNPAELILKVAGSSTSENSELFELDIPLELHNKLRPGGIIRFRDTRNKKRSLDVIRSISNESWLAICKKSAYLAANTKATLARLTPEGNEKELGEFMLGSFEGKAERIRLFKSDRLILTTDGKPGHPARYDSTGKEISPARISCTLENVLNKLKIGDPIWIDDGKIGAIVEDISANKATLRVTRAQKGGVNLTSDKGINLPQTKLGLPPLNRKDLTDLDFICKNADMVGFSFIEKLEDMDMMIAELGKRGAGKMPIIAKIETYEAVKNLPDIIMGTIGRHILGIMIARGDLSVELGGTKLTQIQEEMLSVCEAAHVPVIWATQVLESIAQKGIRSRAELTDAAMGGRAECVMLNKGPYILDAVKMLANILERNESLRYKKFSKLRMLEW